MFEKLQLKKNRQNLNNLLESIDWNQTHEGVSRESRARILILGLTGAGKSTLLNQLCGWPVSTSRTQPHNLYTEGGLAEPVEDYGLFCLADLPQDWGQYTPPGYEDKPPTGLNGHAWAEMAEFNFGPDYLNSTIPLGALDPLELAEGSDLLLYVLDGANGAQAADYRWVGRLRRLNVPLLVVLNKIDLITVNPEQRRTEIEARLAATVLPVSALNGTNVAEQLFTTMIRLCPKLTVALGRELVSFRRRAAHKLINRAALVNGLVALEPVPLLDLPVQVMTLTGLMLRLAAVYNRPADNVRRREMVLAVAGGLAGRYGAQQLAKLVPLVGWLASSLIACLCTWMLGRAAIAYFEGGGDAALDQKVAEARGGLGQFWRKILRRFRKSEQ